MAGWRHPLVLNVLKSYVSCRYTQCNIQRSVAPGAMQLTRMPSPPSSAASAFVSPRIVVLLTAYLENMCRGISSRLV